jgi:hypothetical protein
VLLNTAAVLEPAEIEQAPRGREDLIPLTHVGLELGVPAEGWPSFLGRRGIRFVSDRIGRDAISAGDAQRLLAERRADELRRRAVLKVQDAEAEEKDRAWRAALPKGLPWWALDGMSLAEAAAVHEAAAHPSRTPTPGEWLFNEHSTGGLFKGESEAS